jgi:hypothetical protein
VVDLSKSTRAFLTEADKGVEGMSPIGGQKVMIACTKAICQEVADLSHAILELKKTIHAGASTKGGGSQEDR